MLRCLIELDKTIAEIEAGAIRAKIQQVAKVTISTTAASSPAGATSTFVTAPEEAEKEDVAEVPAPFVGDALFHFRCRKMA